MITFRKFKDAKTPTTNSLETELIGGWQSILVFQNQRHAKGRRTEKWTIEMLYFTYQLTSVIEGSYFRQKRGRPTPCSTLKFAGLVGNALEFFYLE